MKVIALLLIPFLFVGCAHFDAKKLLPHPEPWRKEDIPMLVLSGATALADCYTTERFLDKGYRERNPIVGEYPTDFQLITRGGLGYFAIIVIAYLYPELRYLILGTQSLTCASFAAHNSNLK